MKTLKYLIVIIGIKNKKTVIRLLRNNGRFRPHNLLINEELGRLYAESKQNFFHIIQNINKGNRGNKERVPSKAILLGHPLSSCMIIILHAVFGEALDKVQLSMRHVLRSTDVSNRYNMIA